MTEELQITELRSAINENARLMNDLLGIELRGCHNKGEVILSARAKELAILCIEFNKNSIAIADLYKS